jgi:hypothetical protein
LFFNELAEGFGCDRVIGVVEADGEVDFLIGVG